MSDLYYNLVSAINSVMSSYAGAGWDGSSLTISSAATGSSATIEVSGTIGGSPISQSASGTDGDPGSPEIGTRFALVHNPVGGSPAVIASERVGVMKEKGILLLTLTSLLFSSCATISQRQSAAVTQTVLPIWSIWTAALLPITPLA